MAHMISWLAFIYFLTMSFSADGAIFHVSSFGAYSDDNMDDTRAIQSTVDTAISYGANNTIILGIGTYYLLSTIAIYNATNLTIQGQGMNQTLLIGTTPTSVFYSKYCHGLTISSLSIEYYPHPFTAGYLVTVNSTYLDVKIQPPHQADAGRQVVSLFRYDPIAMRPAFGLNAYQFYQQPPHDVNTSLISEDIVRIPLKYRTKFVVGDAVVVVYLGHFHTIEVKYMTDVTFQSITIVNSWFMGLVTLQVRRLTITDYHVKRRVGFWLSTNADCMHLTDSREYVSVSNTHCQSTGDDALAVHAVYFLVTEIINSTTMMMEVFNWFDPIDVGDSTTLQFSTSRKPFTAYINGTVACSKSNSSNFRIFTFTSPLNVSVGDFACVADSPILTVRNHTAENTRGRGALIQTHNVDLRHSVFNQTSAPAILFQPSLYWHDGPPARNVTLTENLYIRCNEGISQHQGMITFLPDPVQFIPVFDDIRIESSTFLFGYDSQGLLQSNNVNNLTINGNYIALNSSTPIISVCNSRNISAHNNTVVNTKGKIDKYYVFDPTEPCQTNLTSLIDLPPSAFNSSFPPPVLLTTTSTTNDQNHSINEKLRL